MWFRDTIRKVVAGSTLVTEILDAILSDNQVTINAILTEHAEHKKKLNKLVVCARKVSKSMRGRIEINRLAEQYRTEASWPTDDINLRRAYEFYKSGKLADCLPAVDKLVRRLA
jgi:hypothetical protein